jgi:histone H4
MDKRKTKISEKQNILEITNPDIRRLARKAGVMRISKDIYHKSKTLIKDDVTNILKDAIVYTENSKRKTISTMDIVYTLRRKGFNIYGTNFGYSKRNIHKKKPALKPIPKKQNTQQSILSHIVDKITKNITDCNISLDNSSNNSNKNAENSAECNILSDNSSDNSNKNAENSAECNILLDNSSNNLNKNNKNSAECNILSDNSSNNLNKNTENNSNHNILLYNTNENNKNNISFDISSNTKSKKNITSNDNIQVPDDIYQYVAANLPDSQHSSYKDLHKKLNSFIENLSKIIKKMEKISKSTNIDYSNIFTPKIVFINQVLNILNNISSKATNYDMKRQIILSLIFGTPRDELAEYDFDNKNDYEMDSSESIIIPQSSKSLKKSIPNYKSNKRVSNTLIKNYPKKPNNLSNIYYSNKQSTLSTTKNINNSIYTNNNYFTKSLLNSFVPDFFDYDYLKYNHENSNKFKNLSNDKKKIFIEEFHNEIISLLKNHTSNLSPEKIEELIISSFKDLDFDEKLKKYTNENTLNIFIDNHITRIKDYLELDYYSKKKFIDRFKRYVRSFITINPNDIITIEKLMDIYESFKKQKSS